MVARSLVRVVALSLFVALLGIPAQAARLFVDSRPTNLDPGDKYCDMLLREIPRQMLIVMAIDELGADVVDATLEQGAKPQGDVVLGLTRKQNRGGRSLHVDLFDGANKIIDRSDITYRYLYHDLPRIADLVSNMDTKNHARWLAMLGKMLDAQPRPLKWDPSLAVPEEAQGYLDSIDMQNAFLAARMLHQEIAASGQSPARLAALVRAYANMGESMFDLNSAHFDAMFARAHIYAQRLIKLAPNDPLGYWARGYLQALQGLVLDARDDFDRAAKLANGAAAPLWASAALDMLNDDAGALYKKMDDGAAPLASYLLWRSVEYSCLPGLTIRAARVAQNHNPDSMRLFDSVAWNSSVSTLARYTTEAQDLTNNVISRLIDAPETQVPEQVRTAVKGASISKFSGQSMKTLLQTLRSLPRQAAMGNEPHLTWAAYASIIREWNFVNAFSRLFYIDYDTCADPDGESQRLLPYVEGHRYELLIASFNRQGNNVPPALLQKIKALHFYDDSVAMEVIHVSQYLHQISIPNDSPHNTNWANHIAMLSDKMEHDVAAFLWIFRDQELSPDNGDTLNSADLLDHLAPNDVCALVWLAQVSPQRVAARAPQLQRQIQGDPAVMFAMGTALSRTGDYEHASKLLTEATRLAPDAMAYRELAELNLNRDHDVAAYLATWQRYFEMNDDSDQTAALAKWRIAMRLMENGEFDQAVPYAKAGLASNVGNPNEALRLALNGSGRYAEAEAYLKSGNFFPGVYYCWARETGRGNGDADGLAYVPMIPVLIARDARYAPSAALYYWDHGQLDRAAELLSAAIPRDPVGCSPHFLALIRLEQNRPQEAIQILQQRARINGPTVGAHALTVAAEQMALCIADPNARPYLGRVEEELNALPEAGYRGIVCFLYGKICQRQGDAETAKWWYTKAMDSLSASFPGRDAAAVALRELGVEYYP
jgi:tetratricopeptide (TPR) repeat protein